jgi:hypothetical protein
MSPCVPVACRQAPKFSPYRKNVAHRVTHFILIGEHPARGRTPSRVRLAIRAAARTGADSGTVSFRVFLVMIYYRSDTIGGFT